MKKPDQSKFKSLIEYAKAINEFNNWQQEQDEIKSDAAKRAKKAEILSELIDNYPRLFEMIKNDKFRVIVSLNEKGDCKFDPRSIQIQFEPDRLIDAEYNSGTNGVTELKVVWFGDNEKIRERNDIPNWVKPGGLYLAAYMGSIPLSDERAVHVVAAEYCHQIL